MTTDHSHRRTLPHAAGRLTALMSVWLLSSGAVFAAQGTELRWKLEAGTDLVYRNSMRTEAELPQGMGSATTDVEMTQRWSVLEVTGDGDATIRVTMDRVRMSMVTPMGTMGVDSADEASTGSPLDALKAIAGTSFTMVLEPRGGLLEISGVEELRETLGAGVSDPALTAILDQTLSEEALRNQWAQGGTALPDEAVGVGSTWDHTATIANPITGATTVALAYEVESIDGDLVVIGNTGTISLEPGATPQLPFPVEFGDSAMVGTITFDTGRGLMTVNESTMNMQMSMSIGGQTNVIDSAVTMTMELVEGGE